MIPDSLGCGSMFTNETGIEWWCVQENCTGTRHYYLRWFDDDVDG